MDSRIDQFTNLIAAEDCAEEYHLDDEPLCPNCEDEGCDFCLPYEDVPLDGDHDSTMTSIGWGTDEDYGYFGGGDDW